MHPGPSRIAERVVAFFIPPACREEILGDLHERFESGPQFAMDALRTVPLVIVSRMRRTADPQVLTIQAFVLYASFLAVAWFGNADLLRQQWELLRLAIPAVMVIIGLLLNDTYATPGRQSALRLAHGPMLGVIMALTSQGVLQVISPAIAIPAWNTLYGCGLSLLLSSAVRAVFPPGSAHPLSANAGAFWLKKTGGGHGHSEGIPRHIKGVLLLLGLAVLGMGIVKRAVLPRTILFLLVLFIAYHWLKPDS